MEAKQAKLIEVGQAIELTKAAITLIPPGTPLDPGKKSQVVQDACLEVWNGMQDFLAAIHACVESNTGSVWSDPVSGVQTAAAIAAFQSGSNLQFAGQFGDVAKLITQFVQTVMALPGMPANVMTLGTQLTGVLSQLVGKIGTGDQQPSAVSSQPSAPPSPPLTPKA